MQQVIALVSSKHCQPPPPGCPRPIYHLMVECWYANCMHVYVMCSLLLRGNLCHPTFHN